MKKHQTSNVPIYITALFVICLLSLAGETILTYGSMQKLSQYNDWMEHTWRVKDQLKNVNLLVTDAESGLSQYYLSGNPEFLRPWKIAKEKMATEFDTLTGLIKDNPAQGKNLAQLRLLLDRRMKKFDENTGLYEDGGLDELSKAAKVSQDWEVMDDVRLLDVVMEKEELDLLNTRRDQFYHEFDYAIWLGNVVAGLSMLVLMLYYRLIQSSFAKKMAVEEALKTANDNLESTVLERTEQLSVLSHHLLKVSEEEKAKLARELHDEMGSNLTAIRMDISVVADKLRKTEPALADQLQRAKRALQETMDLKRGIIEDLRPSMLDYLGLTASIRSHCEQMSRIAQLPCVIDISEDFDNIDPAWAISLFRITQEALNNVIKYAKATQVKVTLRRQEDGLWLQILDDGVGIAQNAIKKPRTHGLLGMRERALLLGGSFSIRAARSHRGTAVEVFLLFSRLPVISPAEMTGASSDLVQPVNN